MCPFGSYFSMIMFVHLLVIVIEPRKFLETR